MAIKLNGLSYTIEDIPELVRKRSVISSLVFDLKNEKARIDSEFEVDNIYSLAGTRVKWLVTDIQAREFCTVLILTDFTPTGGPGKGTITKPESWLEGSTCLGSFKELDKRETPPR